MKTSTELWQEIRHVTVAPGTVTLWWLYQAGIVVKTPGGTVVVVDPYLSDAVLPSWLRTATRTTSTLTRSPPS